jgi:hypothetical protein
LAALYRLLAKSGFGRKSFKFQDFNEVGKIFYLWKEYRLSTPLYFHSVQKSDCVEFGDVGKLMKNATNNSEIGFS